MVLIWIMFIGMIISLLLLSTLSYHPTPKPFSTKRKRVLRGPIYSGSKTELRFKDGKLVDKNGNEVKTSPLIEKIK